MGPLELVRAEVAQGRVESVAIVVGLDVVKHVGLGLRTGVETLTVNGLNLEAVVPALHGRVVVAVALGAHAGDQAVRVEQGAVFARAVLAAAVRVHDHAARPVPAEQGHAQRIADQHRGHAVGHGPAHDLARVQVEHRRQVQPPLGRVDVGDVADPHLIPSLRRELLLQQVRRHREGVIRVRRRLELARRLRSQALPTQTLGHLPTPPLKPSGQPRRTRAAALGREGFPHLPIQRCAPLRPHRRPSIPPDVVAARRHRQHPAHQPHPELADAQRRPCQRGSRALKTLFPHRHAGSTTYLKSRFQH